MNNNEFPISQFRSNYPFSSTLIHYYSNFYTKNFTENIPALFDLILIFGSIEIFNKLLNKTNKNSSPNLLILISILIFFNPMVMNVYSFSSYEDFHVAYVLLVVFYYNYERNFKLNELFKDKYIYLLLLSLLSVSKPTGFIHVGSILSANLIIFLLYERFNNKLFLKYLFFFLCAFIQFYLWQIHILLNNIFTGNDYQGFRMEIFKNIPINFYYQFLVKKILVSLNLFFFFSPLIFFWLPKNIKIRNIFIFVSIPVITWNLFHMIFFIFIQGYDNAITFHNYFRYLSQFSLIFTFLLIALIVYYIDINKLINLKLFNIVIILLFYFLFILNITKFRRDLSAEYVIIKDISINKLEKYKENKKLKPLEEEIIKFYIKNEKNIF